MKKRVLSMFMALALCLTLLPAPAWAAEDTPEGGAPAADEQPAVQSEPAPQAAVQAAEVAVAEVDGVKYNDIQEAFEKVKQSDGGLLFIPYLLSFPLKNALTLKPPSFNGISLNNPFGFVPIHKYPCESLNIQ